MKKLLSTVAAICFAGAVAYAANLPPVSGPQDPSQINSTVNSALQEVAAGVNGLVAVAPATVTSIATTVEQTLAQQTIPGGTLSLAGQSLRLRCAGILNTAFGQAAVGVFYGTSVVSSALTPINTGASFDIQLLVTYNASSTSAKYIGTGTVNASPIAVIATANTTDNMAANQIAKCNTIQTQSQTAGVTLMNFFVEQLK
jgi:hypothetical protein